MEAYFQLILNVVFVLNILGLGVIVFFLRKHSWRIDEYTNYVTKWTNAIFKKFEEFQAYESRLSESFEKYHTNINTQLGNILQEIKTRDDKFLADTKALKEEYHVNINAQLGNILQEIKTRDDKFLADTKALKEEYHVNINAQLGNILQEIKKPFDLDSMQ